MLQGRDYYLGLWQSKASKFEYDRLIAEWLAAGRPSCGASIATDLTVTELIAAYWNHAKSYYVKNGKPTDTQAGIKVALRLLHQLYGHTPASEFGPLALKSLQNHMIDAGQSRRYVNDNIARIRRIHG